MEKIKMVINKDFTSINCMDALKARMKEFKDQYNVNDLLLVFGLSDRYAYHCKECLKCEVECWMDVYSGYYGKMCGQVSMIWADGFGYFVMVKYYFDYDGMIKIDDDDLLKEVRAGILEIRKIY